MFSEISLIGEEFIIDNVKNYSLSIEISKDIIILYAFDVENNKFIAIESKFILKNFNDIVFADSVTDIIINSNLYNNNYRINNIYINTPKFTLFPNELQNKMYYRDILAFNHILEINDIALGFGIEELNLSLIYAISDNLKNKITEKLKFNVNPVFFSSQANYLNVVFNQFKNNINQLMFVNFHKNYFDILLLNAKKILIYNSFKFLANEDVIYYILFVLEQLHLNPEHVEINLSGFINKDSEIFELIKKYVKTLKLLEPRNNYNYSSIFENIPKHFYFQILNNNL